MRRDVADRRRPPRRPDQAPYLLPITAVGVVFAVVACYEAKFQATLGSCNEGNDRMATKRKIEVFTAGCPLCDETVAMVKRIAGASCDVEVLDMNQVAVAAKAKRYGVARVPAVAINGELADCCAGGGPDEQTLRAAGLGQP